MLIKHLKNSRITLQGSCLNCSSQLELVQLFFFTLELKHCNLEPKILKEIDLFRQVKKKKKKVSAVN